MLSRLKEKATSNQKEWNKKFTEATDKHIKLVRLACDALNEVKGMPAQISRWEISYHDRSKFGEYEFEHYARQFYGDRGDKKGFQMAWRHHYQNNRHHWQYWLNGFDGSKPESEHKPSRMDSQQVMVMIADWLAAGYQYQGLWDFAKQVNGKEGWLNANLGGHNPKIIIHPDTHKMIDSILTNIGYLTNCDNAPLYCLVDPDFINSLGS